MRQVMTAEGLEPPTFGTGIRRATNCAMQSLINDILSLSLTDWIRTSDLGISLSL